MRELRFRYLRKWKRWYIDFSKNTHLQFRLFEWRNKTTELQQYTWLKDKNGKEIFEGDIIKINRDWYDENKFSIEKVYWDLHHWWYNPRAWTCWCVVSIESIEIIWDIHQNPELLNNK